MDAKSVIQHSINANPLRQAQQATFASGEHGSPAAQGCVHDKVSTASQHTMQYSYSDPTLHSAWQTSSHP